MQGTIIGDIFGTLYFLYFQLAGMMLMYMLLKKENTLSKLVLGSATGSLLVHWLPVIMSFLFNFTVLSHVLALVVSLAIPVMFVLREVLPGRIDFSSELGGVYRTLRKHRVFGLVLLLFFVLWCYLLHSHSIRYDVSDASIHTGQCTYGDMNMHLGFISSIAVQKVFPPDYSIFPGTKLAYPFLSDSISSSIYVLGASLRWAYILPMLFAFLQVICGFYMIAYTFLKKVGRSLLAVIFYFLNGGFGFWYFINWAYERKYNFSDIFTGFYTTPTNLVGENIRWVNIIADMLLPQRATLFGYAILFPTIYLLYKAAFGNRKEYFYIAAVFGGALPLIHTHSFLAFGLISASFLLMQLYTSLKNADTEAFSGAVITVAFVVFMSAIQFLIKKEYLKQERLMPIAITLLGILVLVGVYLLVIHFKAEGFKPFLITWGIFLGVIFVLAVPQLVGFTFGQVSEGGFVRGCFNWGNQGDFYPWFYIKNMGIVLLIGVAALCGAKERTLKFAFPIFPIWFLVEMIAFAPNNYDNNKLLYVAYMFLVIIAADYAGMLYGKIKNIKGSGFIIILVLFTAVFSGVLTLGREVVSDFQLYSPEQVKIAEWIDENADSDAVILTDSRHNNIIASMTGRNIVCGSDAYLYYHGINTTERRADIKLMFEEPTDNLSLFKKYNVDYICYSPYEWNNYEIDKEELNKLFEPAFEYEGAVLYKVR